MDDHIICSASPELFFHLDGESIVARPMKGTARRGLTTMEDRQEQAWLQTSEKNRAENVMIVDMLRNDLGRIAAIGSVQVSSLFDVERYPTVWQMTSTVTARTQASLPEIFKALFPCASITGAPKIRTMQIINRLEPEPRQAYTGSIGFIAPGRRAQFNVAIRSVLIDRQRQQAEFGVGGGIIWDSDAADEYQECLVKSRLLSQNWPRFALLETLLWEPDSGYLLLEQHLERLEQSAEYFAYPFDWAQVDRKLQELVAGYGNQSQRVRLLLDSQGGVECQSAPLTKVPVPEIPNLVLAAAPVNSQDIFLYHKTTHRGVYETLQAPCTEGSFPVCDDVILWNERGEISETCNANLVFELDGELVTPPVSSGLLPGVYRSWLLAQGQVREKVVTLQDLPRCSKIYVVNSVRRQRLALLLK
jgi:para-aminobenzoate synthetase/4-amino-4-deoxychorismate lyase